MSQYVIKFSKEGYIRYTSHLDMLRLFKRAFKKSGIRLAYSQGFNPHPKLGFAQPLSLGYSSVSEYLEFETKESYDADKIRQAIEQQMPDGIRIFSCEPLEAGKKSMAARSYAAEYIIGIPLDTPLDRDLKDVCAEFLEQKEIIVPKRQKKTKQMKDVNIRDQIQSLNFVSVECNLLVTAKLDSGSASNLSPELLISALCRFLNIPVKREEIDVMRTKLYFQK